MKEFDFYLSEMSVSDFHGGGLTLERVLGCDLNKIRWFFHVSRFGKDMPANKNLLERCVHIDSLFESDGIKKLIGNTLAAKANKSKPIIQQYSRRAAKKILEKLGGRNSVLYGLCCPQGLHSILTLEALKQREKIEYITWIMDDHLLQWKGGEWKYSHGVEKIFCKHLMDAKHVFVISPAMQEFYLERFGVNSTVLFGPSHFTDEIQQPSLQFPNPIKIGYFGSIGGWQLDVLEKISDSLSEANAEMDIYSGIQSLPKSIYKKGVYFKGRVNKEKVLATMRMYDAILLPISFASEFRNMSQFNIATKMSECLASGVVTVAIGPDYAAMIQYLTKHKAALIETSPNTSAIANTLRTLYDRNVVGSVLQNAQKLGRSEVGTDIMRKKWTSVIESIN